MQLHAREVVQRTTSTSKREHFRGFSMSSPVRKRSKDGCDHVAKIVVGSRATMSIQVTRYSPRLVAPQRP
jgi:hypothetical protein